MEEAFINAVRLIARDEVIAFSNRSTAAPYREPPDVAQAREFVTSIFKELALRREVPLF